MNVVDTISGLSVKIEEYKNNGLSIGFVPTMGALHPGHLSLVKASKAENDITTASIFVNPLQFNNPQDLVKYPRTLEQDLSMLEEAGCDLVFIPSPTEMYPEPVEKEFDFGGFDKVMEGSFRPGHFNGVAIVVERLFKLFQPDKAYFGEKDYQQLMIVQKLVDICGMEIGIVPCPIFREDDGLAMSSRNRRLSPEQREQASLIFRILKGMNEQARYLSPSEVKANALQLLQDNPWFEPDYVEISNELTLQPTLSWDEPGNARAFIAAYMGQVRLIDNMPILRNFAGYAN